MSGNEIISLQFNKQLTCRKSSNILINSLKLFLVAFDSNLKESNSHYSQFSIQSLIKLELVKHCLREFHTLFSSQLNKWFLPFKNGSSFNSKKFSPNTAHAVIIPQLLSHVTK